MKKHSKMLKTDKSQRDADRKRALDFVRTSKSKQRQKISDRPRQSFSSIPALKEAKMMRMAGEQLGIEDPFFRTHAQRACANTVIDGKNYVNFGSYDYIALNGDPRVKQAAKDAIERYGVSASASRLVAGERECHVQLEKALAEHYKVEDAVVFVSGHATNVSTIATIMNENDLVLHDAYSHDSILVGIKLSGAKRRSFTHGDLDKLESQLIESQGQYGNCLVCVEGLYSMDGDICDLPRLLELKEQYGFWLLVDEAHSIGTIGKTGHGVAEHFGVDPKEVDIWMGTMSKTLGSTGGYIAGSKELIEVLKTSAPGFVYSVGLPPALSEAARSSLAILQAESNRVSKLQENSKYFLEQAKSRGFDTGTAEGHCVVPIILGDSILAARVSSGLFKHGFNVLPILYPAVPMNAARLRFFLTSEHSFEQIDQVLEALTKTLKECEEDPIGPEQIMQAQAMILGANN